MAFWKEKNLAEMNREEWESLCDGCGQCCLIQLEDEDSGDRKITQVVCQYMDLQNCRCTVYRDRSSYVPSCYTLAPDNLDEIYWLPETCAYRLLNEGRDLPEWHPLVSGDPETVVEAGISVRGRVLPENVVEVEDLEDHVIRWVDS